MSVDVINFGCRLNAAEAEMIGLRAAEARLQGTVIINSCAVTGEAVRQARQAIRKARRENPDKRIVVTGCAAQTQPAAFAEMPEVDLVVGNHEKMTAVAYRDPPAAGSGFRLAAEEKVRVADIMRLRETAPHMAEALGGRTRAFVQVQNGCDHRCTFCIIPYGRGNSRSVPMGAVVAQIARIVESGAREIVLTGVDMTSYGGDLPGAPSLGKLVRQILKHVPALPRLRISSIDSVEADGELLRAFAEEDRLMPHVHLSLQAGDDLVLKRMKRRHSRADAMRICADLRRLRPGVLLGADLIAGFPTETDAMFDNTLSLVDECGLTLLHVFPFSARAGTPAARMRQTPGEVIRSRAARLRAAGERALSLRLAAEIGAQRCVLVEKPGFGLTEHFLPADLDGGRPGDLVAARICGAGSGMLQGQAIRSAAR